MPSGRRLSNLTRTRCVYTGEPYQFALKELRKPGKPRPVPDDASPQALLESQVLSKLGDGGAWSAHPLGIAHVRVRSDEPIVVHLDSHVELAQGDNYPMAFHALDRLLPYAEPGVQVNGVPGLRIAAIRGNSLHLTLVNTNSRLILRGIPGTSWNEFLDERWKSLDADGYPPLWKSPRLTTHERDDADSYRLVRQTELDMQWLGSGLLRRVALFHTSSSAYSTRSWITDDEWIFELDTRSDVRLDHDTLLSRLAAPGWGLSLRLSSHHCTCDDPPLPDSQYIRQCTYHLVNSQGLPCGMQIRFRSGPAMYTDDSGREKLLRLGAHTGWLDRVLPEDSNNSDEEAGR